MTSGVLRFTKHKGNMKVCPWPLLERERRVDMISTSILLALSHMEAREVGKFWDTQVGSVVRYETMLCLR